ncbi:MAG: P-loop NTPase fold protein [Promethearchaeota archaeon]
MPRIIKPKKIFPHKSFFFTSGSIPPIPTPKHRQKRIINYLKNLDIGRVRLSEKETIGKFICVDEMVRDQVLEIEDQLFSYINNIEKKRPLNVFLYAPPGSGKSYLVKQLIKYLNKNIDQDTGLKVVYNDDHEINLIDVDNYNNLVKRVQKTICAQNRSGERFPPVHRPLLSLP